MPVGPGSRGGRLQAGPLGSRGFGQLANDKRIRVLAATGASDAALESDALGHGLLTYALGVEGLGEGRADRAPRNGENTLSKWLRYGATRVPALAEAVARGDPASRAIHVGNLRAHTGPIEQEPRLFEPVDGGQGLILRSR